MIHRLNKRGQKQTCFNQRDIHFLWPPSGSYRNHEIFSLPTVMFLSKARDFNEQAFRCFAVTLLYSVTVNQLLMTPETQYISKKTSYKDWR